MLSRAAKLAGALRVSSGGGWEHRSHPTSNTPAPTLTHCVPSSCMGACVQPYRISFDRVSSGAIFHQCVYVLCGAEAATMAAGAAARAAFGLDAAATVAAGVAGAAGGSMPHLSLLYSDIDQEER